MSAQEAERPWPGKGTPASVRTMPNQVRGFLLFLLILSISLAAPSLSCGM